MRSVHEILDDLIYILDRKPIRADADGKVQETEGYRSRSLAMQYVAVVECYDAVVKEVGVDRYEFILLLTQLEQRYGRDLLDASLDMLDTYVLYFAGANPVRTATETYVIGADVAFCAFYYAGLTHARFAETEALRAHLREYYSQFADYPLCYELCSRFCDLCNDHKRKILLARIAKRKLQEKGCPSNVALDIVISSALCKIMEICFLQNEIYSRNHSQEDAAAVPAAQREDAALLNDILQSKKDASTYVYTADDLRDYLEEGGKGGKNAVETGIANAIAYNPAYPKYYYLRACYRFYKAFYDRNRISQAIVDEVIADVEKAESLVSPHNKNRDVLLNEYSRFKGIVINCPKNVTDWRDYPDLRYAAAKNKIIRAADHKAVMPYVGDSRNNAPYVFVSYSSKNFRSVYCDIVELQKQGIQCKFDDDMTPSSGRDEKWYKVIEAKIKKAACVLVYLSDDFVVSPAALREVELINQYDKAIIAVDLSGSHTISRLIYDVLSKTAKPLSSDAMYWLCKTFSDDNNVISRNPDPMSTLHIEHIKKRVEVLAPAAITPFNGQHWREQNERADHPMEDDSVCDNVHNVYIVADGVTRQDKSEYVGDRSIAGEVAQCFCREMHKALIKRVAEVGEGKSVEEILHACFVKANQQVARLVKTYAYDHANEIPGCVAVVGLIYNDVLYFGSIGDCMGILVRNGKTIVFADKQTKYAFDVLGLERDRATLKEKYINKDTQHGYGIVNGSPSAASFFTCSHISLEYGDAIYLMSDGVSDFVQYSSPAAYLQLTPQQLIGEARATALESKKNVRQVVDDRAVIKISWTIPDVIITETADVR